MTMPALERGHAYPTPPLAVRKLEDGWLVHSATTPGTWYLIEHVGEVLCCSCRSGQIRRSALLDGLRERRPCRHVEAAVAFEAKVKRWEDPWPYSAGEVVDVSGRRYGRYERAWLVAGGPGELTLVEYLGRHQVCWCDLGREITAARLLGDALPGERCPHIAAVSDFLRPAPRPRPAAPISAAVISGICD